MNYCFIFQVDRDLQEESKLLDIFHPPSESVEEIDIETERYINDFIKLEKKQLPLVSRTKLTEDRGIPWKILQEVIAHIKDVMVLLQSSRHDYLKKILAAEGVLQAGSAERSEF